MGGKSDFLGANPMLIIMIVLIIAMIVLSKVAKKQQQAAARNFARTNMGKSQAAAPFGGNKASMTPSAPRPKIGDVDKIEEEWGYYRYQEDVQPVIKRTDEQQRIYEEYFVVKNIKTTTCDSSAKKTADILKIVATALFWLGLVGIIFGVVDYRDALLYLGIVFVVGAIGCYIGCSVLMKKFKASIKESVAPKKLMTDEDYQRLVEQKIEEMNIEQRGLDKLGLDPDQVREIRPIVMKDQVFANYSLKVHNRKEGKVFSSTNHVTYLYFTDEQLFVYKIEFDMCCNKQIEKANEFFYQDICDIYSCLESNVLEIADIKIEYSTFYFNIIASNSQIGFELAGDSESIDSIQAMKQKIREKKAQ